MHRPYISGPMSGERWHNFPAFFDAEEKLRAHHYDPINPARRGGDTWRECYDYAMANPQEWEAYIRRDTELLLQSDGICLMEGWEDSKGACFELMVAVCIGLPLVGYRENHVPTTLSLHVVHKSDAYERAVRHLSRCGLGGVRKRVA